MIRFFSVCLLLIISSFLYAQPVTGDIFREYVWTTRDSSEFKFLRVIADGDYRDPVYFSESYPKECIENGWINLNNSVDLENAIKAEILVEKVLSHDGTTGLAVMVNDKRWHFFPDPMAIPEPKANFLQHNFPTVQIPIDELKEGVQNHLRFRVDSIQRFGMPQNILYGFRLRIYYNENKEQANAKIQGIEPGGVIKEEQKITLSEIVGDVAEVNYLARYKDVDYEGNGILDQWHYAFYRGQMINHIGSCSSAPYKVIWNTSWVPDQDHNLELSAWLKNSHGIIYFLPPINNLQFQRNYYVEICKPYSIPQMWATREREFNEKVFLNGNPKNAIALQLVFRSWSPGYLNGLYLNDWLVPIGENCNYCYGFHRIMLDKPYFLKQGINTIKTGKTPLVWDKMVHGAEIQFPGIMLLVKYPKTPVIISEINYNNTAHYKVETPLATWFIEKESGGCSSLIDNQGNDWINFKKTGTNEKTNSSDSDFRGMPNLVYREPGNGVGHPGFKTCKTNQTAENELTVTSSNKKWQFRWLFYPNYAKLIIDKTDTTRSYWFLYEGPVRGKFAPQNQYWGNDIEGLKTSNPSIFDNPVSGNWRWVFFGDNENRNTLFIVQSKPDNLDDFFAYMGNRNDLENLSGDGMNVFGFGRDKNTNPLLRANNEFIVGFFSEKLNLVDNIQPFKFYVNELINQK